MENIKKTVGVLIWILTRACNKVFYTQKYANKNFARENLLGEHAFSRCQETCPAPPFPPQVEYFSKTIPSDQHFQVKAMIGIVLRRGWF